MQQQNLCPICGNPILRKGLMYCSMKCYSEARKKRVEATCYSCGSSFQIRPFEQSRSTKHFCPDCRQQWQDRQPANRPLTGYDLQCYYCGQPIYRQRWRARRYLYSFCSKECRSAGWASLRLAHEGLFGKRKKKST